MSARTRSLAAGKGDNRRDDLETFRGSGYWDHPLWWAYLHANGHVIVKQWFGDDKDYTTDCEGNDFVRKVKRPYRAADYKRATVLAYEHFGVEPPPCHDHGTK